MYRFRFILIMVKCIFSKPQNIFESYVLSFRAIPFVDTDFTRLFTQTYSAWTGLGRWHYVFSSAFKRAAMKNRWIPVTTAETMTFRRSIKAGERVRLATQIVCWNERCFFLKQIFTVANEVRAIAISEGIVRGPMGHLRPGDVFASFGESPTSPAMPEEILSWYSMRSRHEGERHEVVRFERLP